MFKVEIFDLEHFLYKVLDILKKRIVIDLENSASATNSEIRIL